MVAPDTAVFIAQAVPWSPATPGPVTADVRVVGGLAAYTRVPVSADADEAREVLERTFVRVAHAERIGRFLAAESVRAVIVPSGNRPSGGISGGTLMVDGNAAFGFRAYERARQMQVSWWSWRTNTTAGWSTCGATCPSASRSTDREEGLNGCRPLLSNSGFAHEPKPRHSALGSASIPKHCGVTEE